MLRKFFSFSARKYAQLKKSRHNRTGKQHSVDDDEDDIGKKLRLIFIVDDRLFPRDDSQVY